MSLIMTKAALALKNAESNFKFVKFEAHKPKKKKATENVETVDSKADAIKFSKNDLELKRIRHEVVKFGMSGFDANKKQEAKIALAVSLGKSIFLCMIVDSLVHKHLQLPIFIFALSFPGAKPPPKPYINYKELMQKRKEEKLQDSLERQQMISKSIMHKTGQKKKKAANNDVGHFLSNYGKVHTVFMFSHRIKVGTYLTPKLRHIHIC